MSIGNFDALVFIGRFQPFHKGHKEVVDAALEKAQQVVIIIGSAYAPRNIRNPFTFEERKEIIQAVYPVERYPNIRIVGVPDFPYNDQKWIKSIQEKVEAVAGDQAKIGLIGHSKDESSYYLKIFPNWSSVEVPNVDGINATDIRSDLLVTDNVGEFLFREIEGTMPESAARHLMNTVLYEDTKDRQEWFARIQDEYRIIREYKRKWERAIEEHNLFPVVFQTVDTVVTCSGHVLLVKRKEMPGAGTWAIPGGFLNQKETLLDGALRELKEETKVKVPLPVSTRFNQGRKDL
jgi:bifunctional NMN adenylyltransferase/nudix hydrolase